MASTGCRGVLDRPAKLGRAVLQAAAGKGDRDGVGAMARAVLDGEISLRDAANLSLYGDALSQALHSRPTDVDSPRTCDTTVTELTRRRRDDDAYTL